MSLFCEGLLIPTKNSEGDEFDKLVENEPSASGDMAGRNVKPAPLKDDLKIIKSCCKEYIGHPAAAVSCLCGIPAGVICLSQNIVNCVSDISCIALIALPSAAYSGCSNTVRCYSLIEGCTEGYQNGDENARDCSRISLRAISNTAFGVIACPFNVVGLSAANLATWSFDDLRNRNADRCDCSWFHATAALGLFYLRRKINPHVSCDLYDPKSLEVIYQRDVDGWVNTNLLGKNPSAPQPEPVEEMER